MTSWLEPLGRSRARRARGSPQAAASGWPGTATPSLRGAWNVQRNVRLNCGSADGATSGGASAPLARAAANERAAGEILAAFAYRRPAPDAPRRFRAIFAAMNAAIVRLDAPLDPDVSVPAADRVLAGTP